MVARLKREFALRCQLVGGGKLILRASIVFRGGRSCKSCSASDSILIKHSGGMFQKWIKYQLLALSRERRGLANRGRVIV